MNIVLLTPCELAAIYICCRYSTNQYTKQYFPTTGLDFYLKRASLPGSKNLALKLWDVSGQAMAGKWPSQGVPRWGASSYFVLCNKQLHICLFQCT